MRRLMWALLLGLSITLAGSTHNVGWQRILSAQAVFSGDSVQLTLRFINHEADTLRGFYFCENIPAGLDVAIGKIKINSSVIASTSHEITGSGALYAGASTHRTILETPPAFTENNALAPGDTLLATFWLSSQTAESYALENAHWVGYFGANGNAFATSDQALVVDFIEQDLRIEQQELADATVAESYQAALRVSGGTPPYTWNLASGSLPDGLVLDSLSGQISGTPQHAGTYSFDVSVRDSGLIIQQDTAYFEIFVEGATSISSLQQPTALSLKGNFPNPFNPTTRIEFSIAQRAFVTITVYDLAGRLVATPVSGLIAAGEHSVNFNAKELNSGVYVYRLQAGPMQRSKKMLLIK